MLMRGWSSRYQSGLREPRLNREARLLATTLRTLIFYTLLVAIAVPAVADDVTLAMLHGSGVILVNGTPIPNTSALLPGDIVETGKESSATISRKGTLVQVRPDSRIVYRGDTIEVQSGSANIGTTAGVSGVVNTLRAVPDSTHVRFELSRLGDCIRLAVEEGSVTAAGPASGKKVTAGKSLSFGNQECTSLDTTAGKNRSGSQVSRGLLYPGVAGAIAGATFMPISPSSPD